MTQDSFVKRAPEIAEGILAKIAAVPHLPKDLQTFSKDLLSKEASVEEEKLSLPKRMSLADLQKLAAGNKVDLPKVSAVSVDSSSDIADSLRKIAERHEQENAEDVFAAAAAIVAHTKQAAPAVPAAIQNIAYLKQRVSMLTPTKPEKSFFGLPIKGIIPTTIAGKKVRAQKRLLEEATPGTHLHGLAQETAIEKARAAASAAAAKERGTTLRDVSKGLGTAAAVGGGVYAGGKALEPRKEERIQVVK